jgi:benzoate-CoA ligase family protein
VNAEDVPVYYNATDLLERNLPERANKTAIFSRERCLTFAEISEETDRFAGAQLELDVRPGEIVAVLAADSAERVIASFAIMKIGAVCLNMNTLLEPFAHAYILRDANVRVLVTSAEFLPAVLRIRQDVPCLKTIVVIGESGADGALRYADCIAAATPVRESARTHRDDFCTLNYSSGTTGEPKGIFHAHKDLVLCAQLYGVDVLGLRESDRTFAAPKLFFTYASGMNLFFPWYVGAGIVLYSGPSRIATKILETIDLFKPTIHANVPTGYALLLATEGLTEKYDLSSIRLCVSAGEALPAAVWHAWKRRTGIDIIDGIGSTEMNHIFLSNRPGDIRPGSSGKPFPGYELKIVGEDGRQAPRGQIGNLLVKGDTAALFYLHQYQRSKRTFVGDWVHTGDKYYIDEDGYYWHAGRSDDMLKVGGVWVSPVEVESALLCHAAVLECAVVAHEDGAGLQKPKAFVVLKSGCDASEELAQQLIGHCREKIADYKRPRWIEFVEDLPKTATGKIQRFKLRR